MREDRGPSGCANEQDRDVADGATRSALTWKNEPARRRWKTRLEVHKRCRLSVYLPDAWLRGPGKWENSKAIRIFSWRSQIQCVTSTAIIIRTRKVSHRRR